MATREEIIWFCGFYEGEGSISNDKSNNNRYRLSISQNDRTPLDLGKRLWGGSVRERRRKSPASDKICICYEWRLSHNDAVTFINNIRPHMRIPYKIRQINNAIAAYQRGHKSTYKCNFCNEVYANPSGRRRHEKVAHIENGVLHECEFCQNTYNSRDSLSRHKKTKH